MLLNILYIIRIANGNDCLQLTALICGDIHHIICPQRNANSEQIALLVFFLYLVNSLYEILVGECWMVGGRGQGGLDPAWVQHYTGLVLSLNKATCSWHFFIRFWMYLSFVELETPGNITIMFLVFSAYSQCRHSYPLSFKEIYSFSIITW